MVQQRVDTPDSPSFNDHDQRAREPCALVVLASSSSGNCSALIHGSGRLRRVTLIDAGLSPARTRAALSPLGLGLEHVDDVLITHLDGDHFHPGWGKALPSWARLHVHERHTPRALEEGVARERLSSFDGAITLRSGARVSAALLDHDRWGVVAFRVEHHGAALGFATDVGRVTHALVRALRGVDVLAIESNYCPQLQERSGRPAFLVKRIMGGAGHLSNLECAAAVREIAPRRHVVLLHLSQQCNTPERAAASHHGQGYALTVTGPDQPTPPIALEPGAADPADLRSSLARD